jgi:hypothetical protein
MKIIKQKHIVEIIKKNKSLDEQNKILSKYLQEMVKENEILQSQFKDSKMTLVHAKNSLLEVTAELQSMQQ